jgi:hypothetical protein
MIDDQQLDDHPDLVEIAPLSSSDHNNFVAVSK